MTVWEFMEKDSSVTGKVVINDENEENKDGKNKVIKYKEIVSLKLTRLFHPVTFKEQLIVEPYLGEEARGKIICSFLKLDTDLMSLFEHGVPFTRGDANKVKRLINDNLLKIQRVDIAKSKDIQKPLEEIFAACCEYINKNLNDVNLVIEKGTGDNATYNINVNVFNEIFEQCEVDMKLHFAKELLKIECYTTSKDSNGVSSFKNAEDKTIKGMSFYKKKVQEQLAKAGATSGK